MFRVDVTDTQSSHFGLERLPDVLRRVCCCKMRSPPLALLATLPQPPQPLFFDAAFAHDHDQSVVRSAEFVDKISEMRDVLW